MTFPVRAVIFDWAGTMIDYGCMAPVRALLGVFDGECVPISEAEARHDMGMAKRDHPRAIIEDPEVSARWIAAKGSGPAEADVERLFARLEPAMIDAAAAAATLIPGAAEAAASLGRLGVRVGSGSGYTPAMMRAIREAAAGQGYCPEVVICAGDTPSGRPSPLMTWAALIQLDAWPAKCCIKVDDAPVGIVEGREAGCWTIGVAASGNSVGLERDALLSLPKADRDARIRAAEAELKSAGAGFVIDDVSQLLPVIHEIAQRIGSCA